MWKPVWIDNTLTQKPTNEWQNWCLRDTLAVYNFQFKLEAQIHLNFYSDHWFVYPTSD